MTSVTFLGATAWLLDDPPDWSSGVRLTATLPAHTETGLTQRESRRPLGDTLRLALDYSTTLVTPELQGLRNALQSISTERILCPLWPVEIAIGATPAITSSYYVLIGDGSAPEIKPASDLPFARPAHPLLVGRLQQGPDPELIGPESARCTIHFIESDALAIGLGSISQIMGPITAGGYRPLFEFRPNWAQPLRSGAAAIELERREIGNLRAAAEAYFDQSARRSLVQGFTLDSYSAWQLLRFFLYRGAVRDNFWLAAGLIEARLTANVLFADTTLTVDQPAARGSNTTVILDDLTNRTCCRIIGTAGYTWQLDSVIGRAYDKRVTTLQGLVLVRFNKPELSLEFDSPGLARTQIEFREVSDEEYQASGETLGSSMGALTIAAHLYWFQIEYPDGPRTWAYTDFERDLTYAGSTFQSGFMEHDTITDGLGLDRQSVGFQSRWFTDNPFGLFIPFTLEWPLMVHIFEAQVVNGAVSGAIRLFRGEVVSVKAHGPFLRATGRAFGRVLERRIPRMLFQTGCNWTLFENRCGLPQAEWRCVGIVGTIGGSSPPAPEWDAVSCELLVVNLDWLGIGPRPTLDAHWFAGGYLQLGAGMTAQWRLIGDNAAEIQPDNEIVLVMGTAFSPPPEAGTAVQFWPGCDGRYETCISKFDNGPRFGGFPHLPAGHPFYPFQTDDRSGKK